MSCVGRRWGDNSANHHFLILLAVPAAAAWGGVILHNDGLHQPNISTARAGGQPGQLVPGCTLQKVDITDEELTFIWITQTGENCHMIGMSI